MSLQVLVIEDDREIRSLMQASLSVEGFAVQTAVTLSEARAMLKHKLPDLIVLDLGLPDGDGVQLVRELRKQHATPVIVVSARHQEAQKIELLDAGADDYLTKPFSVDELLARMRVALRHRGTSLAAAVTTHELEDLRVDLAAHLVERDGEALHLTPTEFKLLALFMRHPAQVLAREQIMDQVWGYDFGGDSNVLEVYVRYLRGKLEAAGEPRLIHTLRGAGYVLRG